MGRQSSRIYFNQQDHKEMVTWNGSSYQYHDKAYIWNGNQFELVWEKLDDDLEGMAIYSLYDGSGGQSPPTGMYWANTSNNRKYVYFGVDNGSMDAWGNNVNIYRITITDAEKYRYSDGIKPNWLSQTPYIVTSNVFDMPEHVGAQGSRTPIIKSGLLIRAGYTFWKPHPTEQDPNERYYYAGADLYDLDNKHLIYTCGETSEGEPEPPTSSNVPIYTMANPIRSELSVTEIRQGQGTIYMPLNALTPSRRKHDYNPSLIPIGMINSIRLATFNVRRGVFTANSIYIFDTYMHKVNEFVLQYPVNVRSTYQASQISLGCFSGNRYLAYPSTNDKLCVGTITEDSIDIRETTISAKYVSAISPTGRYVIYSKSNSQSDVKYIYDTRKKEEKVLKFLRYGDSTPSNLTLPIFRFLTDRLVFTGSPGVDQPNYILTLY